MKQDLATKEIEQRLKQEIERRKKNETLSMTRPEPETGEKLTNRSDYNTLSKDIWPIPEEMRQSSSEYMLMKPKKYSFSENRNMQGRPTTKVNMVQA